MEDSRDFQDVESPCNSKLSYVPSQHVIVPSPREMPSRDCYCCQRPETWDLHVTTGNVFDDSSATVGSLLHGRHPICRYDGSVFAEAGKPATRSEEVHEDTTPTPRFSRQSSTWNPPSRAEGVYPKSYVTDHQRLQISDLHLEEFPTPSIFSCWKISFKSKNQVQPL